MGDNFGEPGARSQEQSDIAGLLGGGGRWCHGEFPSGLTQLLLLQSQRNNTDMKHTDTGREWSLKSWCDSGIYCILIIQKCEQCWARAIAWEQVRDCKSWEAERMKNKERGERKREAMKTVLLSILVKQKSEIKKHINQIQVVCGRFSYWRSVEGKKTDPI